MPTKYKISSAAGLWDSFEIDVDKDGYISAVSQRNSIIIGSKYESMSAYWRKFEGENAYIIEEVKDERTV